MQLNVNNRSVTVGGREVNLTAKEFDIPVLDLYEKLGIDPTNPDEKEKYTADGLHFNDAGQHFIAKALGDFLLAL